MKTAGVVENSGHCTYSIGLKFLKLPFAISFSVFILYIYIYSVIHNNSIGTRKAGDLGSSPSECQLFHLFRCVQKRN